MSKLRKVFKAAGITAASIAVLLTAAYFILPHGPRDTMEFNDPYRVERTLVTGKNYMVAAGTPWAAHAAIEILDRGGNAYDASIASLLALNVTFGHAASFPGVAPILLHDARTGEVISYTGAGTAPSAATVEYFKSHGYDNIPKLNVLAHLLPASPDVLVAVLKQYGTMSFTEVSATAIKIAREGFPIHKQMMADMNLGFFTRLGLTWLLPYNSNVYYRGQWWRPFHHADRFTLPDLANTFQSLCKAEQDALARGASREQGLDAVRDYFYKGPIADAIAGLHEEKKGLITKADLSNYKGYWEKPLSGKFREYTIFANRTWNQGAIVPMVLQLLDGVDLKSMGHNSLEYIHTVLQAIELCLADREAFFGDPAFVNVPVEGLLNPRYAAERRKLFTPNRAFGATPRHGDPFAFQKTGGAFIYENRNIAVARNDGGLSFGKDTSYIAVVDKQGNAVSLTPSDFPESPMVPGTGLTLGTRMIQFYLDEKHPDGLMPGKRPRITPNPGMVFKNGKFYMSYGTPGGDSQTQAMIQFFLNLVVFGMDVQEAISAPRFISLNWPDSFAPHAYTAGTIKMERSLYDSYEPALAKMGYTVLPLGNWDNKVGAVCAVIRDPSTGTLTGGADPREESWAEGK
ncbi:MAG: gamma-glutamyltransferase family protein [Spirochaetes bacterium]|nr:MAG: gamma-glutamyltransferase family protein [Spirochaetota bacterium]